MIQPDLGVGVGTLVADGKAEIGVQQIGELLPIKGIDIRTGPLPISIADRDRVRHGAAGERQGLGDRGRLAKFLIAPDKASLFKKIGLDPA